MTLSHYPHAPGYMSPEDRLRQHLEQTVEVWIDRLLDGEDLVLWDAVADIAKILGRSVEHMVSERKRRKT